MATNIALTIYRKWVKLEVETETRKAAFFQIADAAQEERNEAQLGDEFSDSAYFDRSCQQGMDALLDVLHKFVSYVKDSSNSVMKQSGNNDLETANTGTETANASTAWVIGLSFDGRRNIITSSLASVCHKYIAYHMLYRWAVMTMPNLAPEYKEQREATALDIKRIVYRKEPPTLQVTEGPTGGVINRGQVEGEQ